MPLVGGDLSPNTKREKSKTRTNEISSSHLCLSDRKMTIRQRGSADAGSGGSTAKAAKPTTTLTGRAEDDLAKTQSKCGFCL